jgi:hypothetical protein
MYGEAQRFHIFHGAEDGRVYTWKTTADLKHDDRDIERNSVIKITATVKGERTYKGEEQTMLTRVKVNEVLKRGMTKEEWLERKRNAQLEEATQNNAILYETTYSAYKEHYADCDTLTNSYNEATRTVIVIVPEGRMKASGVRGRRFASYLFYTNDKKHCRCKYAVSSENALKQLAREIKKDNTLPPINEWFIDSVVRRR